MITTRYILISGNGPGAGKDTVATMLRQKLSLRSHWFEITHFADKVKSVCADLWNLTEAQCFGGEKDTVDPRYGVTPRFMFQRVGTDVARLIERNIWIRKLRERKGNFIVPDTRFRNEREAFNDDLVFHIHVGRHGVDTETHASEADASWLATSAHAVILNDGSLLDLERKVQTLVARIVGHLELEEG